MGKTWSRAGLAILAVLSIIVGGAALAWACTPHAFIELNPPSGLVGESITVKGHSFLHGPVTLHWDSPGGEHLGTGRGPDFTTTVTIPQDSPGVHLIVAVASDMHGRYEHAASFEVVANGAPSSPPNGEGDGESGSTHGSGSGADSGSGYSGNGQNSTSASGKTDSQSGRGDASATTSGGHAGSGPVQSGPRAAGAPGSGFPAEPGTGGVPGGAVVPGAGPTSTNPSILTTASGQTVFGGSVGVAALGPATSAEDSEAGSGRSAAPEASAFGNMWGGMEAAGPSLAPVVTADSNADAGAGSELGIGVGLLGAGLVALFGAFLIAEVSRRRVLAGEVTRR